MADTDGDNVDDLLNEEVENDETGTDLLAEEENDSELAVAGDETQISLANDESSLLNEANFLDDTNDEAVR